MAAELAGDRRCWEAGGSRTQPTQPAVCTCGEGEGPACCCRSLHRFVDAGAWG